MYLPSIETFGIMAALALLTAGCGSVTPAGMVAASRLDPLATPPDAISMAVGVPEAMRLTDGDATFRISFRDAETGNVTIDETANLSVRPASQSQPAPNAPGERVYIARIPAADTARIERAQSDIRVARAAGTEGQGSIAITLAGGCALGDLPQEIFVSTWLRTDPGSDYVPLTRRQTLASAMDADQALLLRESLRPCAD